MSTKSLDADPVGAGRYAPSPSGDLHVGNLRTAVLAWLAARASGRRFLLRIDDVDTERSRDDAARQQVADLEWLGLDWDELAQPPSRRAHAYSAAVDALADRGLVYECFCTRREIQSAPSAPHSPPGAYPGTCRRLSEVEREQRRAALPPGRAPALRLLSGEPEVAIVDLLHGEYRARVDDMVLRRGDGMWAYNLSVVIDDGDQHIDQLVRGDDLLSSAPRQSFLAELLGYAPPAHAHVPLVLGPSGQRLAKRDGAVTASELRHQGMTPPALIATFASSCGVPGGESVTSLAHWIELMRSGAWSLEAMSREPWTLRPAELLP